MLLFDNGRGVTGSRLLLCALTCGSSLVARSPSHPGQSLIPGRSRPGVRLPGLVTKAQMGTHEAWPSFTPRFRRCTRPRTCPHLRSVVSILVETRCGLAPGSLARSRWQLASQSAYNRAGLECTQSPMHYFELGGTKPPLVVVRCT